MRVATGLAIVLSCSSSFAAQPTIVPVPEVGMVADFQGNVFVFDTEPRAVLGGFHLVTGGSMGDCVISPDGRRGYVTDSNRHIWVIDLTSSPPQLAQGTNPIAISGLGVDVASTADGRFLVVADSGFVNLVSVIDVATGVESSTFNFGARCDAVDVCSDGSVLIASSGGFVGRLVIDALGHLTGTGEFLTVVDPGNVYCSPNGKSGVAMGHNGQLRSFKIPGLVPVSTRNRPAYGAAGVMAKDGTRFYARSFDGIDAYDFDQTTGELGVNPAYSVSVSSLGYFNFGGADQLALDVNGTTLYTPAKYQLGVNDAVTGATLPAFTMPDLFTSGGICFGPQNQSGCQVAACDDGNPCTDDVCGEPECLHVPDDSNVCGPGDTCVATHVCSAGACVSAGPEDCNTPCPPGLTFIGGVCQRSYDIDASRLDNLTESCDGSGTDRFRCDSGPYGFHWTDVSGDGVGPLTSIELRLVTGVNCTAGQSEVRLNGLPVVETIDPAVACSCSPIHTVFYSYPNLAYYQKDGANVISISPTGSCEGLSTSPILDGLFARVTVSYAAQDPNCTTGECNATTGRCDYTVVDCDDGDPCTDDTCDAQGDCVHVQVPEFTPCDDGDGCNGSEWCGAEGECNSYNPPACFPDYNPCTDDFCDPVAACSYKLIDCSDDNPCTDDACDVQLGCVHDTNAGPCDDGDPCTAGDACVLGVCGDGTPITAPPETKGVAAAADKITYAWPAATFATRYDVVRGGIAALPVGPAAGDEVCFDDLPGPMVTDLTLPAPGTGFWYLSRGEDACGIGTYGTRSDGSARVTATCP